MLPLSEHSPPAAVDCPLHHRSAKRCAPPGAQLPLARVSSRCGLAMVRLFSDDFRQVRANSSQCLARGS